MISDQELNILLEDIYRHYGYDFIGYSKASLIRRVKRICNMDKFGNLTELRHRLFEDDSYVKRFIEELTVNVTEMFRDPSFYRALRQEVIPALATKPFIRIWHAGCSTGEEIFSMAILLEEANILDKALIYGTDLNATVLENVKRGMVPLDQMKKYSENYIASGGQQDFSSYYTAHYGQAKLLSRLTDKVIISTHNLVSDSSFNEFDLIICRNVLIYFNKDLQERVLQLFESSISTLGFLALGSKETIRFSAIDGNFRKLNQEKIWRKTK
ncbi:chemotaxis protein methyltransferase CheR [Dyadobacter jejuensis]|uniref:Chemotaxis protein methyltransferase CheR n=1 Tax=Dyadobacter jejuensis TaxID=1082580 RepID=A0A316AMX8_9BACT|nr:protein-glutamate O-methyltransferase CheR [Dyadobacter jejuensis]PWJ58851.1 chemotaxis protein methyltransferase CheR [Dyadobacter jejuensis]